MAEDLLNHRETPNTPASSIDAGSTDEQEQLVKHDVVNLQDLLDMHDFGESVTWPEGLNQQIALQICEAARKRRRLQDEQPRFSAPSLRTAAT